MPIREPKVQPFRVQDDLPVIAGGSAPTKPAPTDPPPTVSVSRAQYRRVSTPKTAYRRIDPPPTVK